MKTLTKFIIILILIFIILISFILGYNYNSIKVVTVIKEEIILNIDNIQYELVVEEIKLSEGYSSTPYKCPHGYPTIGYGHLLLNDDINYLTEPQADSLLRVDLDSKIRSAYKLTKIKDGNKLLALGLLLFGIGEGNFYNSELYKSIINNDTNIKKNWYKFNKINNKENKNLIKRREYEYNLFIDNSCYNTSK